MVGGSEGREEEAAVRFMNPRAMKSLFSTGKESNFGTWQFFYHPCRTGSSGYRTFCTAQACLFVFFLRSIPGLHEHVFLFCIVTSALYCPMGGSMRRRAGVCCFFFFVSVCIFSSSFIRSRWPGPSSGSMLAGTAVELECATGTESLVLRSRFLPHHRDCTTYTVLA